MKREFIVTIAFTLLTSGWLTCAENSIENFEQAGKRYLVTSERDPGAIVLAARAFSAAAVAYEKSGNTEKETEMNSYLYWCKKKMTLTDIEAFLNGKDAELGLRLKALDKILTKPEDANSWFERVEVFAQQNPDEHLLIAVRYFEVADRFMGTELSLNAQELSLAEMQKAGDSKKSPPNEEPNTELNPATMKKPVPEIKSLNEAAASIKDIFKTDYARTKAEDRVILAKKFAETARETNNDDAGKFVLLREAIILAAQGGQISHALDYIDRMQESFVVDTLMQKRVVLNTLDASSRDPELARVVAAFRTLLDNPDDEMANLLMGRYVCTLNKAWDRGLLFLIKCSDPGLKAAAKKELAGPATMESMIEVADLWFDLAEKETNKKFKESWYEHSVIFYRKAVPQASGLLKSKIEKRIELGVGAKNVANETAPIQRSANPNIKPGIIKSTILFEETSIPYSKIPYINSGILQTPLQEALKFIPIHVEAGVEIVGGQIQLHRSGHLFLQGTEDQPVILRNLIITQDWKAKLEATFVIFDTCEFRKLGPWNDNSGYSTKWKFKSCVFNKSGFVQLDQKRFGFEFQESAFIGCRFPDVTYEDKDLDHFNYFRMNWNKIQHCLFLDCTVTPSIFWMAEGSNFIGGCFIKGDPYNSSMELIVENYVVGMQGELPIKAKQKPVTIKPVAKQFPKLVLPKKCPVPELATRLKIIYGP